MIEKAVEEFAIRQGYKNATFLCKWNGYDCYEPILSEDEVSFTGFPLLILVSENGEIRMSTPDEALQQLDEST